jgi:hypothetical protein
MHMLVDSALIVAAALTAVQSLLVTMENWLCEHHELAVRTDFLKIMIQLLRHNMNL